MCFLMSGAELAGAPCDVTRHTAAHGDRKRPETGAFVILQKSMQEGQSERNEVKQQP